MFDFGDKKSGQQFGAGTTPAENYHIWDGNSLSVGLALMKAESVLESISPSFRRSLRGQTLFSLWRHDVREDDEPLGHRSRLRNAT